MKKFIKMLMVVIISLTILTGCETKNDSKLSIVATNYPCYDFARAVVGNIDDISLKMLLKPGSEMHDYDPTPQDIIAIKKSDIFIYVGGESDTWIEDILSDIDTSKTKVIKLMDYVNLKEEEIVDGMESDEEEEEEEEEVEYDEHVWTSPVNAITIVGKIKDEVKLLDSENESIYEENASNYISKLNAINDSFRSIVNSANNKTLVFGDRFPLRYFVDEYGLSYYAAFPGCSEQTEASAKTISFLINKVKEEKVKVVFHIELSNGKIAKTIADETGAKVLEFHSAHNISQSDFDAGVTYVDIMNKNINVLKEALK